MAEVEFGAVKGRAADSSPPAGAALSGARPDPEPVSLAPASHCSSPAEPFFSSPRERGDRPRGVHLANAVVAHISDVDVARAVRCHAIGGVQMGLDRRPRRASASCVSPSHRLLALAPERVHSLQRPLHAGDDRWPQQQTPLLT